MGRARLLCPRAQPAQALAIGHAGRFIRWVIAVRDCSRSARDLTRLWAIAERSLPRTGKATWTHNQVLMELGALVCTARVKHCGRCPVRTVCATYAVERQRSVASESCERPKRALIDSRVMQVAVAPVERSAAPRCAGCRNPRTRHQRSRSYLTSPGAPMRRWKPASRISSPTRKPDCS